MPPSQARKQVIEQILDELPDTVRQASFQAQGPPAESDDPELSQLMDDLPGTTKAALEASRRPLPIDPETRLGFCMIKIPDGEFPRVSVYSSITDMVYDLGALDGQEISVVPFYGVPLQFSQQQSDGRRYILLPGGNTLLSVPQAPQEPLERFNRDDLPDIDGQGDGWLGHPALSADQGATYRRGNRFGSRIKRPKRKKRQHDSDDEDAIST